MFIAQNLKRLRAEKGLTQEEVAERVGVSGQAVSKWEREECYPDITLLPGLANLFGVTVDELIGMKELSDGGRLWGLRARANTLQVEGKYREAAVVFEQAVKTFPADTGLQASRAVTLAMAGEDTGHAVELCERVLAEGHSDKYRGTVAAALCYLYHSAGMTEKAARLARSRPHARESRELLLPHFLEQPERDAYLRETLPGILTALCEVIDGCPKTIEEQLRNIELGVYDDMINPTDAAQKIADFLL